MQRRGKRPAQSWLTRLRETIARATRLISSTKPVSTSAPAQAMDCQDSYGLPANCYFTPCPLAIGPVPSALPYLLPTPFHLRGAFRSAVPPSALSFLILLSFSFFFF